MKSSIGASLPSNSACVMAADRAVTPAWSVSSKSSECAKAAFNNAAYCGSKPGEPLAIAVELPLPDP
ncbi:hypothetical protein AC578_5865 [Pseudocercospora eumusae]|uniref:Uncharacterized protein n=1 Tax=Pseudocercospora eumusae TaxID=321146 RepID=A0A139HD40_9PEZI|nr:hypothetical protein AC578_5865 [Pseudocercospora eumusae]